MAVLQDGADDCLLDRYERQRRPIAEEEIIQQAHRNRTRMQERDPARRRAMLEDMQRMIDDPGEAQGPSDEVVDDRRAAPRRGHGMRNAGQDRHVRTRSMTMSWKAFTKRVDLGRCRAWRLSRPASRVPMIIRRGRSPSWCRSRRAAAPTSWCGSSPTRYPESLKQPIIIENRAGAAGNVAAMAIKNAQPDGYLLMTGHTGTHAINPTLYTDLKFDPVKDFQPITALIAFNNILVVAGSEPGEVRRRSRRLRQDQARGAELRLAGRRHRRTSARRAVCQACPYQSAARALSRHRAGRDRHGCGTEWTCCSAAYLFDRAACRGRQAPHAGDCRNAAASAHPRCADHAGSWLSGGADAAMVRAVCAGRHACAHRAEAQRRVRQRRCRARRCRTTLLPQAAFVTPEHARWSWARWSSATWCGSARS